MKPKFRLSKSNWIFFAIVAAIMILHFVLTKPDPTGFQIGKLIGGIAPMLAIPVLLAWLVWLISGRKKLARIITFNIVLGILTLSQYSQYKKTVKFSSEMTDFVNMAEGMKEDLNTIQDDTALESAYFEYRSRLREEYKDLLNSDNLTDKKAGKAMMSYLEYIRVNEQRWERAMDTINTPRMFEFTLLNTDREFEYQRSVLKFYIEEAKTCRMFFHNMVPYLKRQLGVTWEDDDLKRGLVDGVQDTYDMQKVFFDPYMQECIDYGQNMIRILDLMQANKEAWEYENDELLMDPEVLNKYNSIMDEIILNELTIDSLWVELTLIQ